MKTIKRIELYDVLPEQIFKTIDDLGVTGMHMTKSSAMMMGSKLKLEFITKNHSGLGSKYRWTGKMMGLFMDFTVEVTKWISGVEKIWITVGEPKLILYKWFSMRLFITALPEHSAQVELSITYEKPKEFLNRILSFIFADWYCKWCLRKMMGDARISLKLNEPVDPLRIKK